MRSLVVGTIWYIVAPSPQVAFLSEALPRFVSGAGNRMLSMRVAPLRTRVQTYSSITPEQLETETVRLLNFDSMVPGQRSQMDLVPPTFLTLLSQHTDSSDPLVMVGSNRLKLHSHGVEVTVESQSQRADGYGHVALKAHRYCEVVEAGEDEGSKWLGRSGRVRWLEVDSGEPTADEARRAAELEPMLAEWLELVRGGGHERYPGHLEDVMRDLGPMPGPGSPNRRALWVAGLVNPLPALGVAMEVRPAVLLAGCGPDATDRRLRAIATALADSIQLLRMGVGSGAGGISKRGWRRV